MLIEKNQEIAGLLQSLAGREAQVLSLKARLADSDSLIASLRDENRRANETIQMLTGSWSWRITKPLRLFYDYLNEWMLQVLGKNDSLGKALLRACELLKLGESATSRVRSFLDKTALKSPQQVINTVISRPRSDQPLPSIPVPATGFEEEAPPYFPDVSDPQVSIIIPVHGQIEYTRRCLQALQRSMTRFTYEVIVVDDASPDDTHESLNAVPGLVLVSNETNKGFVLSCNRGAQEARGDLLVFLNNDTEVDRNWLEELVGTFQKVPDAGLVGSMLVYPDGRLQESGCIVWRDGSAWNYGRNDDPFKPDYNYLREADYCSGAAIAIPKKLFFEVGAFDERYVPAYAEDTDLAFKVREAGYKVYVQPMARVVHFEGVTSGTDTKAGVKAYQARNLLKFYEKWSGTLSSHHIPGMKLHLAADRGVSLRILVLDHCTPTPDRDAGSLIAFNMLRLLRAIPSKITFIPENNFHYVEPYTADLQRMGIEALYAPYVVSVEEHLKSHGHLYDAVLIFRVGVAEQHLDHVKRYCPRAKIIFHTQDLHFLREEREGRLLGSDSILAKAQQTKRSELDAMAKSDLVIVVSSAEEAILRQDYGVLNTLVLPLIMEPKPGSCGFTERSGIAFIGGFQHPPNIDAVHYFAENILPLIRAKIPEIRFFVVGSDPPDEIRSLQNDHIIVTGYVPDLGPLLDRMRLSVAPIRYGAGIKGKIGTALSYGVPTVATRVAVEGMGLLEGEEILVADDPETFAERVVELYTRSELWASLSKKGLDFVRRHYSFHRIREILKEAFSRLDLTIPEPPNGGQRFGVTEILASKRLDHDMPRLDEQLGLVYFRNQEEYSRWLENGPCKAREKYERRFASLKAHESTFVVSGQCYPCGRHSKFLVDRRYGAVQEEGVWIPNWRERLVCGSCGLNNRQRLVAALTMDWLSAVIGSDSCVYMMEQVTPLYAFFRERFPGVRVIGSEFLNPSLPGGRIVDGIRHEDAERLSFLDSSVDVILSNDVLEHVNEPMAVLAECARVLRPGGMLVLTIPFHEARATSVRRASVLNGEIKHHLEPQWHSNPISPEGSLVFTDFGWDVLEWMRGVGFDFAEAMLAWSPRYGHFGRSQFVFRAMLRPAVVGVS
ncbi:MAG: glycosyltransferase [Deltaproteobacteria bacterium]|nr:glycosyltransferase [Deltaproteobacteria bacterium]